MRLYILVVGLCGTLLSGTVNAKEKYEWRYNRSNEGILTLWYVSDRKQTYDELSLSCVGDGSLAVEAKGIILWTDVGGGSRPEDFERFSLETAALRLEATLEPVNTGYSGWAAVRYDRAVSVVDGIIGGEFIVVRAIHRKPVMERAEEDYDIAKLYPAPDLKKVEVFRQYCSRIRFGNSNP